MQIDYQKLRERMGDQDLSKRMNCQANHHAEFYFGFEKKQRRGLYLAYRLISRVLHFPPLFKWGYRNALNVGVTETEVAFDRLPKAFDGYRILHISDLHIDGVPELLPILIQAVEPLEYDLCVLTGDYREGTLGDYDTSAQQAVELCRAVRSDVVAVLGNHDAIEMVSTLEAGGIRVLLNEHIVLNREGQELVVLGVDDPHYHQTDNVERALRNSPEDKFKILLAHSPEITHEAVAAGVDFYLCGHTHAGQICLPNGRPILTASRGPKHCHSGLWEHRGVTGYTSAGAGTSTVSVRFNCRPEITVHTLRSRDRRI